MPLAGPYSSHLEVEEEDEFEVESPFGDLGDPNFTEANLLFSETPFEEDMGI